MYLFRMYKGRRSEQTTKTKKNSHVYRQDLNDQLSTEKAKGSDQTRPEDLAQCPVGVFPFGVQLGIPGLLSESLGLDGE